MLKVGWRPECRWLECRVADSFFVRPSLDIQVQRCMLCRLNQEPVIFSRCRAQRTALYIISSLPWVDLIHVRVKKLSCTRHKHFCSSTPVLCNVSHLIFPWLKSPIIVQSPLLTSLIAMCIFSLFCYVGTTIYDCSGNCCMSCN